MRVAVGGDPYNICNYFVSGGHKARPYNDFNKFDMFLRAIKIAPTTFAINLLFFGRQIAVPTFLNSNLQPLTSNLYSLNLYN